MRLHRALQRVGVGLCLLSFFVSFDLRAFETFGGLCLSALHAIELFSSFRLRALGALNRMVPAFQMLFVATPAQLLLSLGALMLSLAACLHAFLRLFDRGLAIVAGG